MVTLKIMRRSSLLPVLLYFTSSYCQHLKGAEFLQQIAGVGLSSTEGNGIKEATGLSKRAVNLNQIPTKKPTPAPKNWTKQAVKSSKHTSVEPDFLEDLPANGVRHPLIFWPGFGTSRIEVRVENQELDPECPSYGTFHASFGNPTILEGWSESCIYKMLEVAFDPKSRNFSSKASISTAVASFGSTSCAYIPYEPLYLFLEALGYTNGLDFFVACYDWRMTPHTHIGSDVPHLELAKQLVEQAYSNTGLPVYLSGHSNGPLYTLALLNSMTEEWRQKYVAGFIGMAGNWVGQGGTLAYLFSGQSLFDSSWYPGSTAAWQSWPASYMQLADPKVFADKEVLLESEVKGKAIRYTALDYDTIFRDAAMPHSRTLAALFVGSVSARNMAPHTHFYGFYGSGTLTRVGVTLSSLVSGQEPVEDADFFRDGDGDQEDLDNLAALKWRSQQAKCLHFELNEMRGSTHLGLPLSWRVLYRLAQIVYTKPPQCPATV